MKIARPPARGAHEDRASPGRPGAPAHPAAQPARREAQPGRLGAALLRLLPLAAVLSGLVSSAWAQGTGASIDEACTWVRYVDAVQGRAANDGTTPEAAVDRIETALAMAFPRTRAGRCARLVLRPGDYRESIGLTPDTKGAGLLILEAEKPGEARLLGSDNLSRGWTRVAVDIYRRSDRHYAYPLGEDPWCKRSKRCLAPLSRHSEAVRIAGVLLQQKLTYDGMAATPNSFFVDSESGSLTVHSSADPNLQPTEVFSRPSAVINTTENLVLRGLVVENYRSTVQSTGFQGAVFLQGANQLVEDVTLRYNNAGGLKLFKASDVTLRRIKAEHNGILGLGGSGSRNVLMEDIEVSYTGSWRGCGRYYQWDELLWTNGCNSWAEGGMKWLKMQDVTMRRIQTHHNEGAALWFDSKNDNIDITDYYAWENRAPAFFWELGHGALRLHRFAFWKNGHYYQGEKDGALYLSNAGGPPPGGPTIFESGILWGNETAVYSPNKAPHNWDRGAYIADGWTFRNVVFAAKRGQVLWNLPFGSVMDDGGKNLPLGGKHFIVGDEAGITFEAGRTLFYYPDGAAAPGSFIDGQGWGRRSYDEFAIVPRWRVVDGLFSDPLFADPEDGNFSTSLPALQSWDLPTDGRQGWSVNPPDTP